MEKQDVKISDVLNDTVFRSCVTKALRFVIEKRLTRPSPKKGFKYKRDWYDRMKANNQLNDKFFLENIGDIWIKKSKLNSESRNIIAYVCKMALIQWEKSKKLNL